MAYVLFVVLNTLCAALVKSFCQEVLDWWRPWAGVLVVFTPLGTVLGILIIVLGFLFVIGGSLVKVFISNFGDFFVSHPPKQ